MRVVIHVGLRKTATTAIQEMLTLNAPDFGPDILVLSKPDALAKWRKHVFRFMRKPRGADRAEMRQTYLNRIWQEARKLRDLCEASGREVCIISEENLFGSKVFVGKETLFDWGISVLPVIEEAFGGHDLRFVCYQRGTEAWLSSCHNQEVKNNRLTLNFEDWSARLPRGFSVEAGVKAMQAACEVPFRIVQYEDEVAEAPILGAGVLEEAGFSEDDMMALSPAPRVNESLKPKALEFILMVNRLGGDAPMVRRIGNMAAENPSLFA